jgi:hypothetical protein
MEFARLWFRSISIEVISILPWGLEKAKRGASLTQINYARG